MKNLLPFILLFVFVSAFSQTKSIQKSQPLTEAYPEDAGMSPERLKRIDALLEEAISSEQIPGAVALIVRDGNTSYW